MQKKVFRTSVGIAITTLWFMSFVLLSNQCFAPPGNDTDTEEAHRNIRNCIVGHSPDEHHRTNANYRDKEAYDKAWRSKTTTVENNTWLQTFGLDWTYYGKLSRCPQCEALADAKKITWKSLQKYMAKVDEEQKAERMAEYAKKMEEEREEKERNERWRHPERYTIFGRKSEDEIRYRGDSDEDEHCKPDYSYMQ